MKTLLATLAEKYGTDKLEHGYIPYYEKHMPNSPESLLEIGCFKGASLKMWKEYYTDKTKISTIDLFGGAENISHEEIGNFGIKAYKGSQSDVKFLYGINEQFDVIIDDGSHNSDDQLISFKHLFINNLKPGGVYVVEDLHCCNESFYWGAVTDFRHTMLGILQRIKGGSESSLRNNPLLRGEGDVLEDLMGEIRLYDDKIAFIFKNS